MATENQNLDLDVIDLGDASVETKGIVGAPDDLPGGQGIAGILQD